MKKVLIIEDDHYLLAFYHHMQSKLQGKVAVHIVDCAAKGVEALKKEKYDTLLLDLIMPEEDGYAVLGYLEQDTERKPKNVQILTNIDTPEDRAKTSKMGADDYYVKAEISHKELEQLFLL